MPRTPTAVFGLALWLLLSPADARGGLIVNGDFEQGNTGFMTQYVVPTTGIVGGEGQYDLVFNPANHHPDGASYGDHTTGMGLLMMVNGDTTPNQLVWGQTVAVDPNTEYHFAAFISSWIAAAPGQLDVLFNGTSIGTMSAPSTTGIWVPFSTGWESGPATSLTIELRNLSTADVGNDFALDDLSLTPVPEPSTLTLLGVGTLGLLGYAWRRRKQA